MIIAISFVILNSLAGLRFLIHTYGNLFTRDVHFVPLCSFKFYLKRRLRLRTLQLGVARNMNELYDSVDSEAVLSILVHKVII